MGRWIGSVEAARLLNLGTTHHARELVVRLIRRRVLMGRFHSGKWKVLRAHVECILSGLMILE